MDRIPEEFTVHLQPLIMAYGLDQHSLPTDNDSQAFDRIRAILVDIINKRSPSTPWNNQNSTEAHFNIINVPLDYKLPDRKNVVMGSKIPAYSPHSPLVSSSKEYPDGLISSQWIHKHRRVVPSVFLGFHELPIWQKYDPNEMKDPLKFQHYMIPEKEKDAVFCAHINERRRTFSDRFVRFALVLMVDSQEEAYLLEERLAYIRKMCGLDPKSIFVLYSETSYDTNTLDLFLKLIEKSLWDISIAYYKDHSKRITKKRKTRLNYIQQTAKNVVASSNLQTPPVLIAAPLPIHGSTNSITTGSFTSLTQIGIPKNALNAKGWNIRYDIKLAIFAEFRQDFHAAVKNYEDAYNTLLVLIKSDILSNSTSRSPSIYSLPVPAQISLESDRWLEYKELSDFICFKIAKICFYLDSPIAAIRMFNTHIENFKDLPEFSNQSLDQILQVSVPKTLVKTDGTMQYWDWLTRQYRIFGELIELVVEQKDLKLPYPPSGGSSIADAYLTALISPGTTIPAITIQHAGYYYYTASLLATERDFRRELGVDFNDSQKRSNENPSDQVIELLTKSYDQFKNYKATRMTLFLASEIANIYTHKGKNDRALKFFEKIGRTYREEKWIYILESICNLTLHVAKKEGDFLTTISCFIELLSYTSGTEQARIMRDFSSLLDGKCIFDTNHESVQVQSLDTPINVTIDVDQLSTFLICSIHFQKISSFIGLPVHVQVSLGPGSESGIPEGFELDEIRVNFSNDAYDFVIHHSILPDTVSHAVEHVTFSDCTSMNTSFGADLCYVSLHEKKVFEYAFKPLKSADIKILKVTAVLKGRVFGGIVNMEYRISDREPSLNKSKWYRVNTSSEISSIDYVTFDTPGERTVLRVLKRQLDLNITCLKESPVYLDDLHILKLIVKNPENKSIHAHLNVQFGIDEDSLISESNDRESVLQSGPLSLFLGEIEPNSIQEKSFKLKAVNSLHARSLKAIFHYSAEVFDLETAAENTNVFKKIENISIEAKAPWIFDFQIESASSNTYYLFATIISQGSVPCQLKCASILGSDSKYIASIVSISELSTDNSIAFLNGQAFSLVYVVTLTSNSVLIPISLGKFEIEWKRVVSDTFITTATDLPELNSPADDIEISLDSYAEFVVGSTTALTYTLKNPTKRYIDISANIESSEAFVFSGYKAKTYRILPLSTLKVYMNVFAIKCGKFALPKLQVMRKLKSKIVEGKEDVVEKTDADFYKISGLSVGQHIVYVKPSLCKAIA